jgi:hypothetical protein
MKKLLKLDLKTILIIVLLAAVIFSQFFNGSKEEVGDIVKVDGKKYELLKHTIDTVYQEIEIEVPTYVPEYITKIETVEVQIPANVDSLKVIKDYFSKYEVKDTLVLEGLGKGYIIDVISQNKIESRNIKWDYKIPTILDTKIVKELPKNQLYLGLNTNFDKANVVNSVGVGAIFKTKRDRIFQLNTGIANSITGETQPYVGGGIYWKLKLRK